MPDAGFPVEIRDGLPVVTTPEEIDITNAARLRGVLLEAAAGYHGTLVVDMSRTQFCDTAGIHALVSAHKRAQSEDGDLRLVIATPTVKRIFTITGLNSVISYYGSLDEALAEGAPEAGEEGFRP